MYLYSVDNQHNMAEKDLSQIVGEFYEGAGSSNGFQAIPSEEVAEKKFDDYWFEADFEDPETTIGSKILECRFPLPKTEFLGSISIRHSGLIVYRARVNRVDKSVHANRQFRMDDGWIAAVEEINARYR
jgi:hypothetical protein